MRRIPFILLGLLIPLSLQAQPVSPPVEALSPWVQGVIETAERGIRLSESEAGGSCRDNDDTFTLEIWANTDIVSRALTLSDAAAQEMEFFRERTICFESDRRLLQDEIQKILDRMNEASTVCNIGSLRVLRETFQYLHDAYLSFLKGAVDPTYQDDRLRRQYVFEDATYWNTPPYTDAVLDAARSNEPLCPYTTDYGPHTVAYRGATIGAPVDGAEGSDIKSYGCDAETLRKLPPAMQEEAEILATFIEKLDEFSRPLYTSVSASFQSIDAIIAILTGKRPPDSLPGVGAKLDHDEKTDCLRPLSPESGGSLTPEEIERTLLAFPNYFDRSNLTTDPFTGLPTYNPPPEELLPFGMLFRPTETSAIASMKNFIDKKEAIGFGRPLPNILQQTFVDMFSFVQQNIVEAPTLRSIAGNNERVTGMIEASNRDAVELTNTAAEPLHRAVVSLVDVIDTFLAEEYVPSVGYFLARSCVDGHCQQTIRSMLKRIHNPYCHPYISGDYTDALAAQKCFCDSTVERLDPTFWAEYCVDSLTDDERARYQAIEPVFVPACLSDEEEAARIEEANRTREEERAKKP